MAKRCYVLIGPPGAGKSTWIEKEFQGECFVVSSDAIIEEVAKSEGKTYNDVFAKYIKAADRLMWDEFSRALVEGQSPLIIDRTNMSRKSRARIFERMKWAKLDGITLGYTMHAVVFPAPEKEEWERRLNSRPGKTIPDNVIRSMIQSFEMPTLDEGFDTVTVVEEEYV